MRPRSWILPLVLGFAASFVACDDDDGGDVGAPCKNNSDCASGLICDEHEGQSSCQEAHGHETGHDSEHESEHEPTAGDDSTGG